jgi:hypothetical protein
LSDQPPSSPMIWDPERLAGSAEEGGAPLPRNLRPSKFCKEDICSHREKLMGFVCDADGPREAQPAGVGIYLQVGHATPVDSRCFDPSPWTHEKALTRPTICRAKWSASTRYCKSPGVRGASGRIHTCPGMGKTRFMPPQANLSLALATRHGPTVVLFCARGRKSQSATAIPIMARANGNARGCRRLFFPPGRMAALPRLCLALIVEALTPTQP